MFCSHIQGLILRCKFYLSQAVSAFVLSLFCFCSNACVACSVADYVEPAWNCKLYLNLRQVQSWFPGSPVLWLFAEISSNESHFPLWLYTSLSLQKKQGDRYFTSKRFHPYRQSGCSLEVLWKFEADRYVLSYLCYLLASLHG